MSRKRTHAGRRASFREYLSRVEWPMSAVLKAQEARRLAAIVARARGAGVL